MRKCGRLGGLGLAAVALLGSHPQQGLVEADCRQLRTMAAAVAAAAAVRTRILQASEGATEGRRS